LGEYEKGWVLNEWRWQREDAAANRRDFKQPLWLGQTSLKAQTILLYAEQGLGDTIQFCRYATLLKEQGATVVLEAPVPLHSLLKNMPGIDICIARGEPLPEFDWQCPLLSLPLALKTRLDTIPLAQQAYIHCQPDKLNDWQSLIGKTGRPRIGWVWSGSTGHGNDQNRSLQLVQLRPLTRLREYEHFSLQKEIREIDRQELISSGIRDYSARITDFSDTAALCQLMDLVITVDTSVAHLAAAMGRPTWIMLPSNSDWRWLLERQDSPWYGSVRLFRSKAFGDWSQVIQNLAQQLEIKFFPNLPLLQAVQFHRQGQLDQACEIYDQLLSRQPDMFDALHMRGVLAFQRQHYEVSAELIARAIALRPNVADAHLNLGNTLHELNRWPEAEHHLLRSIELAPQQPLAFNNLGNLYRSMKRWDDAIGCYRQALELQSDFVEALNGLGVVMKQLGRLDEALKFYDAALKLQPGNAQIHYNRANALEAQGEFKAALSAFDDALALRPGFKQAMINKGNVYRELKQTDRAIELFDRLIELDGNDANAHSNKALVLLMAGDYENGWQLHEWRWKRAGFSSPVRPFTQALWLGQFDLKGRTILLHQEQGLGDTLQFFRYVALVKALGARVILEVQPALISLLEQQAGVDRVVSWGEPAGDFDCHCPLMSLPLAFKTELNTIPFADKPYLKIDHSRQKKWASKLGVKNRIRVAVVWSSVSAHKNDHQRSLLFDRFSKALPQNGLEYHCLQPQIKSVDEPAFTHRGDIAWWGDDLIDFAETAALCSLMDLVITVDTSVAHLAAAMGRTTWVLLPSASDWRWLIGRPDSPWYASVRLFRQDASRQWDGVLKQIQFELRQLGSGHIE